MIISREQYRVVCAALLSASVLTSHAVSAQTTDTGKIPRASEGDGKVTQGGTALPEEQVRRRLDAAGYHDIDGLAVDGVGIWRGMTIVNGKKISVTVDSEGRVLAGG